MMGRASIGQRGFNDGYCGYGQLLIRLLFISQPKKKKIPRLLQNVTVYLK